MSLGKNNKVIGLIKDELGVQIMKKFVGLKTKAYCYLKGNNDEGKKAKGTKKSVIKKNLKFRDYIKMLKASKIGNIIDYLEKKEIEVDCPKEDKK